VWPRVAAFTDWVNPEASTVGARPGRLSALAFLSVLL
jgi:hypothetical protein